MAGELNTPSTKRHRERKGPQGALQRRWHFFWNGHYLTAPLRKMHRRVSKAPRSLARFRFTRGFAPPNSPEHAAARRQTAARRSGSETVGGFTSSRIGFIAVVDASGTRMGEAIRLVRSRLSCSICPRGSACPPRLEDCVPNI
jgi:hypothetical protein